MQVFHLLPRKSHQVLLDAKENLTLYLTVVRAQEVKVRQKSSGNRILYRHYSRISTARVHCLI